MAYGLLGLKTHMEGNSLNAMRSLADSQEKNKIANENIKQAEKAQKTSTIGTAAGIGFMVGGPIGGAIGALAGLVF
ncbi:hypothetical protein [Neptuniibacter sp. UBA847]|uniref:hypothetical protein n=1 Tax=Neptuniibacter sp. UBA847 TaxID=1946977 RepID=UPI000C690501|nr:hypothetical protein [Neptuniibacter sp. UBA847]MAY42267.1 bacteriocin [Oceanospirillaceae bacterium]|tara:strand:+ start:7871 stop:8098 length:228 start_codon:yes stop_codon:yes gene_type:complete